MLVKLPLSKVGGVKVVIGVVEGAVVVVVAGNVAVLFWVLWEFDDVRVLKVEANACVA